MSFQHPFRVFSADECQLRHRALSNQMISHPDKRVAESARQNANKASKVPWQCPVHRAGQEVQESKLIDRIELCRPLSGSSTANDRCVASARLIDAFCRT